MTSNHHVGARLFQKITENRLTKQTSITSAGWEIHSQPRARIAPKQIGQFIVIAVMDRPFHRINCSNIVQMGTNSSVNAYNMAVNNGSQWHNSKQIQKMVE
jgi:hypothetical protein